MTRNQFESLAAGLPQGMGETVLTNLRICRSQISR